MLHWYTADNPFAALVLAHGAGGGQTSPFMVNAGRELAFRGISTATFDFDYMAQGRRAPDAAPVCERRWRRAIEDARPAAPGLPLFIGGKSFGGRMASHVASQGGAGTLAGLVFLGYPLHPPGKPQQRRDAHLPAIPEPMLFVQGSRDTFGTADEIRELLPGLQRATLHEVAEGDHGFKVPKRAGDPSTVMGAILDAVAAWARQSAPL
ncbi:MAG: alpha/beta hydrolase [Acidobacteria bacterium]|nr:alpha/beta hydrolase [Acidobacteriota bacterium]